MVVWTGPRLSTFKYFQESNKGIEGYNKLTTTIKATIVKKMIFLAFCEKITVGSYNADSLLPYLLAIQGRFTFDKYICCT